MFDVISNSTCVLIQYFNYGVYMCIQVKIKNIEICMEAMNNRKDHYKSVVLKEKKTSVLPTHCSYCQPVCNNGECAHVLLTRVGWWLLKQDTNRVLLYGVKRSGMVWCVVRWGAVWCGGVRYGAVGWGVYVNLLKCFSLLLLLLLLLFFHYYRL